MTKGNSPIRVSDSFEKLVDEIRQKTNKTSAQITEGFAKILKRKI